MAVIKTKTKFTKSKFTKNKYSTKKKNVSRMTKKKNVMKGGSVKSVSGKPRGSRTGSMSRRRASRPLQPLPPKNTTIEGYLSGKSTSYKGTKMNKSRNFQSSRAGRFTREMVNKIQNATTSQEIVNALTRTINGKKYYNIRNEILNQIKTTNTYGNNNLNELKNRIVETIRKSTENNLTNYLGQKSTKYQTQTRKDAILKDVNLNNMGNKNTNTIIKEIFYNNQNKPKMNPQMINRLRILSKDELISFLKQNKPSDYLNISLKSPNIYEDPEKVVNSIYSTLNPTRKNKQLTTSTSEYNVLTKPSSESPNKVVLDNPNSIYSKLKPTRDSNQLPTSTSGYSVLRPLQ